MHEVVFQVLHPVAPSTLSRGTVITDPILQMKEGTHTGNLPKVSQMTSGVETTILTQEHPEPVSHGLQRLLPLTLMISNVASGGGLGHAMTSVFAVMSANHLHS